MKSEHLQIKQIGKIITGKTPPTENSNYFNGVYPFITPTDIKTFNERILTATDRTISDEGKKYLIGNLLPKGAICFVSIGSTIGKMCLTNCDSYTNQQINSIICSDQFNEMYIFYLLRYFKGYFQTIGAGTGSGKGIVKKSLFEKTKIPVVLDKTHQNRIANILSRYDDLIEKNNRKIAILEEQIQELYKEWFVRFRFPGYEKAEFVSGVPKDWKFEKVGERYNITIGKTPPREETNWFTKNEEFSIDWSSIADIRKGMFLQRTSEQLTNEAIDRFHIVKLPKRTILLSFKLTVGLVAITTQEFTATNEAIAHFICQQSELEYLYMFLKNYDYNRLGNTSSIGNAINSKIIRKMDLVVPTKKVLELFHNKTKCMFDEIEKVRILNSKIEIIRDSLFPRLMSGKLKV